MPRLAVRPTLQYTEQDKQTAKQNQAENDDPYRDDGGDPAIEQPEQPAAN